MGIITSQRINDYYERFKSIDVTFSKEIIQVTGLLAEQVHLKCMSDFWPCVIYSSSFEGAKVVSSIKSGILAKLRQSNNSVSLRFCFKDVDNKTPLTFFVSARVLGHTPQGLSADMGLFSLQFAQRPPDTLVEIMGRILDANFNFTKRRDERIPVTAETMKKLTLLSPETAVFIQGVPRRCMLRDLSFSGAKVIIMGVAKFLENREASLRVDFDDPRASYLLKGSFGRSEIVEGRQDLVAMVLQFTEAAIPMGYKLRLSDYLNQVKMPEKKPSPEPAANA
ncbi:cyclic di-GMP binding protein [Spirochaetia bacterium]|nr:cyclic di-GMP binding protein [Spirochaetia bacterium]